MARRDSVKALRSGMTARFWLSVEISLPSASKVFRRNEPPSCSGE
jgi:hypothetical protein